MCSGAKPAILSFYSFFIDYPFLVPAILLSEAYAYTLQHGSKKFIDLVSHAAFTS